MSDEIEIIRREFRRNINDSRAITPEHIIAALTEAGYAIVRSDSGDASGPGSREPSPKTVSAVPASIPIAWHSCADTLRTRPQASPDSPIPDKATDAAKNAQGAPAATGGDSSVWYRDTASEAGW